MDVAAWLRKLGLERYVAAFQENEVTACQRRNGPVADRDNRHACSNAAGYHVRAGDRPWDRSASGRGQCRRWSHALIAEACGVPAELAVLIPRQLKAPIEPDSNLHAHHP